MAGAAGCVAGIPAGITVDMPGLASTVTCTCTTPLCNKEHWCESATPGDKCATSGAARLAGLVLPAVLALAARLF